MKDLILVNFKIVSSDAEVKGFLLKDGIDDGQPLRFFGETDADCYDYYNANNYVSMVAHNSKEAKTMLCYYLIGDFLKSADVVSALKGNVKEFSQVIDGFEVKLMVI